MTAASGPIRVYLADDHGLVRFGMKSLLESEPDIEVVGEAADGARATTEICEVQPDVVVLDLRMPESNGIEVCTAVKAQCPAVKILVLTSYDEDEEVFGAINAGADGYLLKENQIGRAHV
jgi:two-component system response regulator DevR